MGLSAIRRRTTSPNLSAKRGLSAIGGICVSIPLVPKKHGADAAPPPPKREITRRQMVAGALVLLGAMVVFPAIRWLTGGSDIEPTNLSEISPPELEIARRRWQEKGPLNYNLEIAFVAPATKTDILLEVRGGVATKLVKNGTPVSRQEELSLWTVEGQFDQIKKYVSMDTSPAARNAGWTMVNVGKFDEALGYPADYSRQGTGHMVKYHITVTKFEEVTP